MPQVIQVDFINPVDQEKLFTAFTAASSHEEAITVALASWSHNFGVLKNAARIGGGKFIRAGANSCWRYIYNCTLEDEQYDRGVVAVLFTQYKEKEKEVQNV